VLVSKLDPQTRETVERVLTPARGGRGDNSRTGEHPVVRPAAKPSTGVVTEKVTRRAVTEAQQSEPTSTVTQKVARQPATEVTVSAPAPVSMPSLPGSQVDPVQPTRSRAATPQTRRTAPEMRQLVDQIKAGNPEATDAEIAKQLGINVGRVREVMSAGA
jgi:hypothetical protein